MSKSTPNITRYDPTPLTMPSEKRRRANNARSIIGWLSRRSCRTNQAVRAAAATNSPMISGEVHPTAVPNVRAVSSPTTAGKKRPRPLKSKGASCRSSRLRGTNNERGQCSDQPDRDVDEEDQPPTSGCHQKAADGRAQRQPECLRRPLYADGPAQRASRHHQDDDGQAVGLQHRRPQGLEGAEATEGGQVGGESAEHGGHDEDAGTRRCRTASDPACRTRRPTAVTVATSTTR